MQSSNKKKFFIIDAMAMAFRNFHAFGVRPLTNSRGLPTSAVFGSAQFLIKIIGEERPDFLAIACDSIEPTFRHEMYAEYKANRSAMPEDLAVQLPYLFKLFAAMGIPMIKHPGFEADDIIASMVRQFASDDLECFIVSGDKDFMQLINDHVFLYVAQKGGSAKIVDHEGVREKFGCTPKNVIDVLALIGDSSDNIPGVKGIGEKGAAKLVADYGSVEEIYENMDKIPNARLREVLSNCRDMAFLSKRLVTLDAVVPEIPNLQHFAFDHERSMRSNDLLALFRDLEFRRLSEWVEQNIAASHSEHLVEMAQLHATPTSSNKTYQVILNRSQLEDLCAQLSNAKVFSFDTETTGLDMIADRPIGISFSTERAQAFYLPLTPVHGQELTTEEILSRLKDFFSDPSKLKVGHNLKFDLQMLRNSNCEVVGPFFDTMIASYLINANTRSHGLDACCAAFLNHIKIPTSHLLGKKNQERTMLEVDIKLLTEYACEDADYTLRLYDYFAPLLKEENLEELSHSIEMPLVKVLARMEQEGVYLNRDALHQLSEHMSLRIDRLETEMHTLAGEEFNINSTKQLQRIIFERLKIHETLGLTRLKKTKSGYSTDVSVLERMESHPFAKALLDYRTVSKLKNTYVDILPELIHPKTGRIHTHFHQTGTATGRLSSADPNLQNIPIRSSLGREIRKAFCASSPETVLISADYSQIELRLLAHLSGDENLIAAFQHGEDIHTSTAAKIFGVPVGEVSREMRGNAKAINFGIIYGMGASRLARQTGVSVREAQDFIERYFATYPAIRSYIEMSVERAKNEGCTRTMYGRKRAFDPEDHEAVRSGNPDNIAINSPIQGSAADLIKIAMVQLDEICARPENRQLRMLLQVHDELVFECHRDRAQEHAQMIKKTMESVAPLRVPLVVDVGVAQNWLATDD